MTNQQMKPQSKSTKRNPFARKVSFSLGELIVTRRASSTLTDEQILSAVCRHPPILCAQSLAVGKRFQGQHTFHTSLIGNYYATLNPLRDHSEPRVYRNREARTLRWSYTELGRRNKRIQSLEDEAA